MAIAN